MVYKIRYNQAFYNNNNNKKPDKIFKQNAAIILEYYKNVLISIIL